MNIFSGCAWQSAGLTKHFATPKPKCIFLAPDSHSVQCTGNCAKNTQRRRFESGVQILAGKTCVPLGLVQKGLANSGFVHYDFLLILTV